MMRIITYCGIFFSTFTLSLLFVPLVRTIALRTGITDNPTTGRKDHEKPTPLLGGLAIYASFALVIWIAVAILFILGENPHFQKTFVELVKQKARFLVVFPKLLAMFIGASLLVFIGFIDDKRGIYFSPKIKFITQVIAALIAVAGGVRTQFMPTEWLNYIISTFWIVGICNSFNFLDNMDGLSAGIGAIASGVFFSITAMQGQFFSAMILAALIGSLLGFLRHNFYPATIFMGDMGSLFIGYMLGTLTITSSYIVPNSPSLIPVIMPLLILSVPLYDTITVVWIRTREKRPIYIGDKRHFSHRLVDLGFSKRNAVIYIYLVSFGIAIAAALLPYITIAGSLIIILQTVVVYILLTILINVSRKK